MFYNSIIYYIAFLQDFLQCTDLCLGFSSSITLQVVYFIFRTDGFIDAFLYFFQSVCLSVCLIAWLSICMSDCLLFYLSVSLLDNRLAPVDSLALFIYTNLVPIILPIIIMIMTWRLVLIISLIGLLLICSANSRKNFFIKK